jgi:hypothetical protein
VHTGVRRPAVLALRYLASANTSVGATGQLFRVGAPPAEVNAGWRRRGYRERRFVEASEVSAKLAIAS